MNRFIANFLGIVCLMALVGCQRKGEVLEPQISFVVQDRYLKSLPPPFPPLTDEEKKSDWGKEYLIGVSFAKSLDLYQAITAFKRADILLPQTENTRKMEAQYEILLCYYLGKKYADVISTYDNSLLRMATPEFPVFEDLLILVYDSYVQLGEEQKAKMMLQYMQQNTPEIAKKLQASTALSRGDFTTLRCLTENNANPSFTQFLTTFEKEKKSVGAAKTLNALLPGAGYLYLGQKQSAITAFLLNGAFIAAAYQFFHRGYTAAGIITTSFEAGWYFGGIAGAAEEAKFYNERLYESYATPLMNQQGLFPVFMLKYAF